MKSSVIGYRLSVALLFLAAPLTGQTSLSIYRDGRVVVRRTLPQALQQGRNSLTLRLEGLDPATCYAYRVQRGHGIDGERDGIVVGNVLASYTHLRAAGGCDWPRRFAGFVRDCAA